MINYKPFFDTITKKNISQYQLINKYLISTATINRLKNNQNITLKQLENICNILKCDIEEVVTFNS